MMGELADRGHGHSLNPDFRHPSLLPRASVLRTAKPRWMSLLNRAFMIECVVSRPDDAYMAHD